MIAASAMRGLRAARPIECRRIAARSRAARSKDVAFMWILVAEALGALGLLLFIVWWTLGPAQRREREALQREIDAEASRAKPSSDDRAEPRT
jgi:hypothetical protein